MEERNKVNAKEDSKEKQIAIKVSKVSIGVNVVLSLFKLFAGIAAHSGAMISDAVHSASDVFGTFIVMIGVTMADKKSDKEHPYGHERLECVASIILAVILMLIGLGIGIGGIKKIIAGDKGTLVIPGKLALIAAVVSIVVKEWMYWYTRGAAKKIHSGALMAEAWHHRSDALSSVGAFIGILGARLGAPILDPIVSVCICIFIGKAAFDIFRDAMDKMVDKSCDDATVQNMRNAIIRTPGVEGVDLIRTRMFGAKVYVDIEISADGEMSLNDSHKIAESVHDTIEREFPEVKHCMVHVNPSRGNGELKAMHVV